MSLGRKTARGIVWNYVSYGAGKLLTFVSTIILARLLAPEQFGVVAIALLAIGYLDVIGDLGVAAALIYQRGDVERAANVAFGVSLAAGAGLWALMMLAAPWVAAYFGQPAVAPMLRVLALTLLIQSFGNVQAALLSKELEFRRALLPDLARSAAKGFGAIGLALLGWGAWSLVWGQVLGAAAATAALWIVHPLRPRLTWDAVIARGMLSYGLQIVALQGLSAVWDTADYVIVGKRLGSADLGLYQQAFRVSDLLIVNLCFVLGRVLFPSYAKLGDEPASIGRGVLATLRYVALVTLPLSIGLCAAAPLFVSAVFGPKWLGMIPALQLLALRAGLSTLFFNVGHVLKAIGKPAIVNRLMLVKIAALIPALLFAVRFGFVGVALAQVAVTLFGMLIDVAVLTRVVGVPLGAVRRQIQPALLASAGMGLAVWGWVSLSTAGPPALRLAAAALLGALAYAGLLWLTERRMVVESARAVARVLRPEASSQETVASSQ